MREAGSAGDLEEALVRAVGADPEADGASAVRAASDSEPSFVSGRHRFCVGIPDTCSLSAPMVYSGYSSSPVLWRLKMVRRVFLAMCIAAMLESGCSSQRAVQYYQDELTQLVPGETQIDEFRSILPKAYLVGQNMVNGIRIDAYEISHTRYDIRVDSFVRDHLWFYFQDKTLLSWGEPGDWPEPADVVVEIRDR